MDDERLINKQQRTVSSANLLFQTGKWSLSRETITHTSVDSKVQRGGAVPPLKRAQREGQGGRAGMVRTPCLQGFSMHAAKLK